MTPVLGVVSQRGVADMQAQLPISTEGALSRPAQAVLGVAACLVAVLLVFWPTTWSMVEIWRRNDTFQHCFVVIPISLWLIWGQRDRLAATSAAPLWPGLLLVVALGAAYLLGALSGAQIISQFAVVAMVGAVVLTVFGTARARVVAFPLFFLLFAVPFGEAIVPRLMDWTADVTIFALRLSGVPVYREGVHFVIPSGSWSVIAACSGVKFLIASLMAGTLYAYLIYRSWSRRLAFVAVSLTMPIFANWLRAYLVVMIGHLSNNRLMGNDDHIVFGWILFAAVMLLTFWLGLRWRQDESSVAAVPARAGHVRSWKAVLATAVAVLLWPAAERFILQRAPQHASFAPAPRLPAAPGWVVTDKPLSGWTATLVGARDRSISTVERDVRPVEIQISAFEGQRKGSELATSAHYLVPHEDPVWRQTGSGTTRVDAPGVAPTVRTATLLGPSGRFLVWQWYVMDGVATISDAEVKLRVAAATVAARPDRGYWVALLAPYANDPAEADRRLRDFVQQAGPSLAMTLEMRQ